jgi:putative methyltransferase (TIGR04325 family)
VTAREVILRRTPDSLVRATRRLRAQLTGSRVLLPAWEHVPEGWQRERADPFVKGWDVPSVQEWHRRQFGFWSRCFAAPRPLGGSEYAEDAKVQQLHPHNVHVSWAYVLALLTHNRSQLSILDWGGGVGQYYLLGRATVPDVVLSYHCRDVPLICAVGRELNPDVTFYEDETCFARTYDLVLASNSIQYSEDWQETLGKLARAADGFVYVAQLPTVDDTASFVAVQRPYAHAFDTEYLGWIFNRSEFLATSRSLGLELVREFFYGHTVVVHGIREPAVHRGFVFRPAGRSV